MTWTGAAGADLTGGAHRDRPGPRLGDLLSARARQGGILVAFFQMAGDAGAVTGPVVAGLLVDSDSYPAAFALAGGVLAVAALLAVMTPELPRDRDTPT